MLSAAQIKAYHELGYILVENAVAPNRLDRLKAITDEFISRARGISRNNEVYDLEESHTPDNPRVRRLKEPVNCDPFYWELVRSAGVIDPVRQLIGPNLRLHGSKLNMKFAQYGAAVEWHQDWAFYPHTNDDLLAVGVMLDDVVMENGPLLVLPGSHRGPIYSHHHRGYFTGAVNLETEQPELSAAVPLTGKAGSMTVHHVRALHGSALNTSARPRRILFYEIAAADAWPLLSDLQNYRNYTHFTERMIVGISTLVPRVVPAPIRMPMPIRRQPESIYDLQSDAQKRAFGRYTAGEHENAT
ncbi:MAG TPA: phytanoyl-CoA dioxygenase family protein [Pseudolabrys sp.]|jgi:ectoine hydroxylase-related dioxygenase (phytanoyl-CoA dioxygenase family)|nr:phytanoyl-CoA dioxygenase family protein [Pseudolabrys sp.]